MDGTAASRSMAAANGRASRGGAYCVRNSATPTETGTERTIATTDEMTVTHSRSGMPNCGGLAPGFHTRSVRKFAESSASFFCVSPDARYFRKDLSTGTLAASRPLEQTISYVTRTLG